MTRIGLPARLADLGTPGPAAVVDRTRATSTRVGPDAANLPGGPPIGADLRRP